MKKIFFEKIRFGLFFAFILATIFNANLVLAQKTQTSNVAIIRNSSELLKETATADGPGIAVLVARGDKVILRTARGMANIELSVSLTADNVFQIASITKMFTAALVVKLSEEGKLSLDDNLSKFLPDFPNAKNITIRQLLNHTAGISDQVPPELRIPGFSRRDVDTATYVGEIAKRSPSFVPGSDQSYSNAGFILLGAVIEKITGKKWFEAMDEKIFKPLGLKNTKYGVTNKIIKGLVEGYTTDTEDHLVEKPQFISLAIPAAAGGLISTVDDLHLWMRSLVGGRVINKNNFQQMITPFSMPGKEFSNPYGFGMFIWSVRGETMFGHTGQINGFAAVLVYLPSEEITIVALGNDDNFDAKNFGRKLAAIALGNPYPKVKSVSISEAEMQTIAGKYQDVNETRTFLVKDGKLYSQREGRNPILMQVTAERQIHFVPAELSYFVHVKDSKGEVIRLDYYYNGDGPPKPLLKLDSQK